MNRRMVAFVLGRVLLVEAALMVPSLICGLIYREKEFWAFIPAIVIAGILGALLSWKKPENSTIYARDGFVVVASAWIAMSVIGAVPLYLCGRGLSVWDCIFEIVSGFTTTGASVFTNVDIMPKCILFWRSFTHWVGGMGVLVFVLAILPLTDNRSLHIMRAEVPGPIKGKLVPRMRETAKILYGVYTVMTVILIIMLLAGGMPLFDALCYSFGTAGTGGFATSSLGVLSYNSAYIEIVISVFMILFGVNFNIYYLLLLRRIKPALKNEEMRWYLIIIAAAVLLIGVNIYRIYGTVGESFRMALFQVSSIMTTTGFATADFAVDWPQFSQHILLLLMIFGACAGSTGGGIKISRLLILVKSFKSEVRRMAHPNMVTTIRMDNKAVSAETINGVRVYFTIYMLIIFVSTLLLSLDGLDFTTNLSAELACVNNIGPGIGLVGPMGNYSAYSPFSKMLLSFNMLLGRLEIFPILVLFSPKLWSGTAA